MSQAVAYKRLKTMDNCKTVTPIVAVAYEKWSLTRIFNYKSFLYLSLQKAKGVRLNASLSETGSKTSGYSTTGFSIYRREIIHVKESVMIFFGLLSMLRSDWLSHY